MDTLVRSVVLQHVEDEAFLDGLSHGVDVKRNGFIIWSGGLIGDWSATEQLHCLGLWRGREGKIADALVAGASCHLGREQVFGADLAPVLKGLHLVGLRAPL